MGFRFVRTAKIAAGHTPREAWQRLRAVALVVERTFAWINQLRRLRIRYDQRADIHEAFLWLGSVP